MNKNIRPIYFSAETWDKKTTHGFKSYKFLNKQSCFVPTKFPIKKNPKIITNCCICLEALFINDKWTRLSLGLSSVKDYSEYMELECKHTFHHKCIIKWFKSNNTCPLCRKLV